MQLKVRVARSTRCEQNVTKSSSFAVMAVPAMTRGMPPCSMNGRSGQSHSLIHIVGAPAVPHRWPWTLTCTCSWTSSASLFCCACAARCLLVAKNEHYLASRPRPGARARQRSRSRSRTLKGGARWLCSNAVLAGTAMPRGTGVSPVNGRSGRSDLCIRL